MEENKWLNDLYDTTKYNDEWIQDVYDNYKYQGFDREDILDRLSDLIVDPKLAAKIIIVCAMKGPVRASTTIIDGRSLVEMGIPARRRPGTEGISCGRITSATADLAAYFLKKTNCPKRLAVDCPAWLQFPSAGSIKMPERYREMHREFSIRFSEVIGGQFKEEIYMQMEANSYIDPTLRLFE
jgi:hypothetical protein